MLIFIVILSVNKNRGFLKKILRIGVFTRIFYFEYALIFIFFGSRKMDEENSEEVTNPENEENPDEPRALNGPFLIMPYERDLLLETMDKDVLFISAL